MSDTKDLGQKGEDLATEFLKKNGYKILFRNWVWGKNEIDIIAEKDDIVAFVEVKTRNEEFLGGIGSAISRDKRNAIIFAAEGYIKRYGIDKDSRFDIIAIIMNDQGTNLDHYEGAFYPTLR